MTSLRCHWSNPGYWVSYGCFHFAGQGRFVCQGCVSGTSQDFNGRYHAPGKLTSFRDVTGQTRAHGFTMAAFALQGTHPSTGSGQRQVCGRLWMSLVDPALMGFSGLTGEGAQRHLLLLKGRQCFLFCLQNTGGGHSLSVRNYGNYEGGGSAISSRPPPGQGPWRGGIGVPGTLRLARVVSATHPVISMAAIMRQLSRHLF